MTWFSCWLGGPDEARDRLSQCTSPLEGKACVRLSVYVHLLKWCFFSNAKCQTRLRLSFPSFSFSFTHSSAQLSAVKGSFLLCASLSKYDCCPYSWVSADLDPSTEPYNLVGRSRFGPRQTRSDQCGTSANGRWKHNQQSSSNWRQTEKKIIFKTIWKRGYATGTPRIIHYYTILLMLQLKMVNRGHLVTRRLIVRLQLRLEECSRDPLNKRTAVWSHNPALSHGPEWELALIHSLGNVYSFTVWRCLEAVKVLHLSRSLFPPPSPSPPVSLTLFSPTYFHWP